MVDQTQVSGDTNTQTQTHANSNTHMHKDVRAVVIHIINVKRSEFHIKMDTKINRDRYNYRVNIRYR